MTTEAQRPWAAHIKYMARVEVSHIFAEEARNPPRCESAKAYRAGAPLTEALEIARNVYAARTGQPVLDLSEDSVFDRAKEGNKRAIELLLGRLRPRVLAAAKARPASLNDDDAEDVTQESLLLITRKLHKIPEARNLVPFALKITTDLAIDFIRREERRAKVIVFNSEIADAVMEGAPSNG